MDNNHKILVIDDDAAVRHSLQWLLESAGHWVTTYHSAGAFLDDLDHCITAPASACLIVDMQMPDMNGLALQHILAHHYPCLPIIFISSYADEQQVEQALTTGAIAFLTKPFNDAVLLAYIQEIFESD